MTELHNQQPPDPRPATGPDRVVHVAVLFSAVVVLVLWVPTVGPLAVWLAGRPCNLVVHNVDIDGKALTVAVRVDGRIVRPKVDVRVPESQLSDYRERLGAHLARRTSLVVPGRHLGWVDTVMVEDHPTELWHATRRAGTTSGALVITLIVFVRYHRRRRRRQTHGPGDADPTCADHGRE